MLNVKSWISNLEPDDLTLMLQIFNMKEVRCFFISGKMLNTADLFVCCCWKKKLRVDYLSVDTWIMKASDNWVLGVVLCARSRRKTLVWIPCGEMCFWRRWIDVGVSLQLLYLVQTHLRFVFFLFWFCCTKCETTFVFPCCRSFGVLYFNPSTSRPHTRRVLASPCRPSARGCFTCMLHVNYRVGGHIKYRNVHWRQSAVLYQNHELVGDFYQTNCYPTLQILKSLRMLLMKSFFIRETRGERERERRVTKVPRRTRTLQFHAQHHRPLGHLDAYSDSRKQNLSTCKLVF